MTKNEQVARLCAKYRTLALMDAANLARRIKYEALGKSDPSALAAKLIALKGQGRAEVDGPEDEQIWSEAMFNLAPAPKAQAKIEAKPQPKPVKKPEAE